MKQKNSLIVCIVVVSILLICVLLSYNPELSLSKLVQHHTNENWSDVIPDTNEGFTTLKPIAFTRYNTPGSPRYPKTGEELTDAEKGANACGNFNRATPATNGLEIPYAGDPNYNTYAQRRNQFQEKGLVPPGFKDDKSKNACKIGGLQGAIPEGTPCIVRIGTKYLAYNKKNNMAIMTEDKDNELCRMILRYPNFAFNKLFLQGNRELVMFENRNGDYLTCGVPWENGWDMAYYIHMNPEQSLKHFGLLWHPHFSPRRDQWTSQQGYDRWRAIPETTETYQINYDKNDPNDVLAFGEAAERKYYMGPWKGGRDYWNNNNRKTMPFGQIFGWAGDDSAAGPYSKLFPGTALFPWGAPVPNQGTDTYLRMGSWNDWNNTTKFEIFPITHEIQVPTIIED